ncbi:MAG: glutamine amidotransferase [Planctomycetota bacterium]
MSVFEFFFKLPAEAYARGRLIFKSSLPGEVRLLIAVGLAALAWYLYRRVSGRVATRPRRALLGLRAAALVLLSLVLGIPALRSVRPRASAVFTAVLVDVSKSMSIEDAVIDGKQTSRIAAARALLTEGGVLEEAGEHTRVLLYAFDGRARRASDVAALEADGQYTDIFRSIRDVDGEVRSLPLASVVLLTDGCRNTGGRAKEAAKLLKARGVPLHVAGFGNPTPPRDYEVVQVFAPRRVRRNTEVELYATVRHTDFTEPFDLQIVRGQTPVATKRVEPGDGSDITSLRIPFTPDHEGTGTYQLVIPPAKGESVVDNNVRDFVIDIQDDRLPVLYIEGSPRTEYRLLRRALFRDRDFRLVGLLRLASGRFYVQGANRSEAYLASGFPDTRERLFAFQAVILGDIEASHFTDKQLDLLEAFVRERGGGLLMLGGVNSFGLGRYAGTPVGRMLPFVVSPSDPQYSDERYSARATPQGLKHPVMRLSPDLDMNRRLWEKAPPLIGITPVRGVKPGAQLLIRHETRPLPVLAVQHYGQGRVAGFTSGGSWYWQMSMPAADQFHERFWKQLIRWLVVGAREQLTAEVGADIVARREAVHVRSTALGPDLRPVNDAVVVARVTDPLGNTETIPMDWILSQEGVYQCRTVPDLEGEYRVSVSVEDWEVEPAETGFLVGEPLIEFGNAGLKEALLDDMARSTGGYYFEPKESAALVEAIAQSVDAARYANIQPKEREIWDSPFLFALLLGIMGAEWLIRRKAGLA